MKSKIKIGISNKRHGSIKTNQGIQKKNLEKFLKELEISSESFVFMNQTHSSNVEVIGEIIIIPDNTDAMVTRSKNKYLGVTTADCVPVLLFDDENGVVGVAHAGFRGMFSGVIENAVSKMKTEGADMSKTHVIFGPSIQVCCYDVGSSRAKDFIDKYGTIAVENREEKEYLDLMAVGKQILIDQGINNDNIFLSDICTQCNQDQYFSYRGNNGNLSGQFVSVIGLE